MSRDWVESEHPRWPAKTPDSKGGEFRGDGPEGWAEAAVRQIGLGFNAGRMSHAEVASYVDRTDYTTGYIAGGDQSKTELRIYSDGRQLVHKSTHSEEGALGEVEYSLVARALGAPAPAAVWYSEPDAEVLIEYIPGETGWEHYLSGVRSTSGSYRLAPGGSQQIEQQFAATDAGIMIGLVDIIGSHADRHPANWIVDPNGIPVAIDNADTFDPDGYQGSGGLTYARSPFAYNFVGLDSRGNVQWVDNPMHPDDIREARRRLEKLYRSSGGLQWHSRDGVMDVLDSLERHATGTRRRIP